MVIRVTRQTSSNLLTILESPTNVTHCKVCHSRIHTGELRVSFCRFNFSSYHYHLYCFQPITHVRIDLSQCEVKVGDRDLLDDLRKWVCEWNRQFAVDWKGIAIYQRKGLAGHPGNLRRPLIEIFRYLDRSSLVLVAGRVSRSWYEVTWDDELWPIISSSQSNFGHQRALHIAILYGQCIHCGDETQEPHMICPLFHRPKCYKCYQKRRFRPQRLCWVMRDCSIGKGLIRRIGLKVFKFDGKDCLYLYLSYEPIGAFRCELAKIAAEQIDTNSLGSDLAAQLRATEPKDWYPGKESPLIHHFLQQPASKPLFQLILSAQSQQDVLITSNQCKLALKSYIYA